ncbi:uncharacterized protein EV420DRAFT_1549971 [Desarmillaria tabescens]|uniref:DUF6534 domain-containing protein n=1 Tax=Armillaria tabescens TaxID=1929756 RepID=A0AA39KCH1_ARMTA|nr:uncharacterized protein EV420DRAFT_1549971 [Desarmillaria tabescens]KAK0457284.1 hypothetical protein EV420DRAFT_1549971 [Desarmillaria tabescens]
MPPLTTPPNLSVVDTFGAVYIGVTIAAILYGITILQTAIYYKVNPNDPWVYKYAVAILWILDTLNIALSAHVLYFYLIESFGNYSALSRVIWSFPLQIVFNMLIAYGVQALYAVRIWKFGRHFHLAFPWFIFLAVAATFGTGIYAVYDTYTVSSLSDILTNRISIYTAFATMVGADFAISGAMCFYLNKGRTMTSFSSTTKIIVRLMRVVVISGMLTGVFSLLTLVAYIGWSKTFIFMALGTSILPKLYINSLLAMLNSRESSMWSVGKKRPVDDKTIEFASYHVGSRTVGSGQTNITIPGLSLTGTGTNISVPLSVTEGSRPSSTGDMTSV